MHIISICTAAHAKSFNWFSCIFVADWQIFTSKKSLYKCSGVLFVLMYEVANVFKTDPKPQIFDFYSHPFSSFPDLIFHRLKENINVSTVWQEKVDSFAENRYRLQAEMIRQWRMCSFWFVQVLKKQSRTFSSHKTFICCYQTHSASNLL